MTDARTKIDPLLFSQALHAPTRYSAGRALLPAVMCVCVSTCAGVCARVCVIAGPQSSVDSAPPLCLLCPRPLCTHATRYHQAQADRRQGAGAAQARQASEGGVRRRRRGAAEEARGEPEPTECLQAQGHG